LPAPFCPRKPYISPCSILNDNASTATSVPNFFVRFVVSIINDKISEFNLFKIKRLDKKNYTKLAIQ